MPVITMMPGFRVIVLTFEIFRMFREMGKKVIYVTNNATKCRREYVHKFEQLNFGGNFVRIYSIELQD
jgi:ribonucleotide monophosphatase NagD (HAD superfamily)